MICNVEVVLVQDSEDVVTHVLEEISTTGIVGNLSIAHGSLNISDIPGNHIK